MPSLKLTPSGNVPPSCKYLCTASRPVNTVPEINTSSPTFSARIFSSVKGKDNLIMVIVNRSILFLRRFVVENEGGFPSALMFLRCHEPTQLLGVPHHRADRRMRRR